MELFYKVGTKTIEMKAKNTTFFNTEQVMELMIAIADRF